MKHFRLQILGTHKAIKNVFNYKSHSLILSYEILKNGQYDNKNKINPIVLCYSTTFI